MSVCAPDRGYLGHPNPFLTPPVSGDRKLNDARRTAQWVCADHLRAISYLIADGVYPSNVGRGYVLRRIIRRAVRYSQQLGTASTPVLERMLAGLLQGPDASPLLKTNAHVIQHVVQGETAAFLATLNRGMQMLDASIDSMQGKSTGATRRMRKQAPIYNTSGSTKQLPAQLVFTLYDTYGFPVDLTQVIALERGYTVDLQAVDAFMEQQRALAKAALEGAGVGAAGKRGDGECVSTW